MHRLSGWCIKTWGETSWCFWVLPVLNVGWNRPDRSLHFGVAWLMGEAHLTISCLPALKQ